jgi:hypothetical protein
LSCDILNSDYISDKITITDEFGNFLGGNINDWCSNIRNQRDSNSLIMFLPKRIKLSTGRNFRLYKPIDNSRISNYKTSYISIYKPCQSIGSPLTFSFGAAYPNPTSSECKVQFTIPTDCFVLIYFDSDKIVNFEQLNAGYYEVIINGAQFGFHNEIEKLYIITSEGQSCEGYIQFGNL